jgi:monoamine oxidase
LNFVSGFKDLYDGDDWQWDDDGRECLHLRGGNDQLATRLARRVGEQGKVLLGHRLLALEPRDTAGWRATVQRGDQQMALQGDWVVLALPFSRLREADLSKVKLSARKRLAIGTLGYGTNTKVIQAWDGQPWRQWGLAGSLQGNEETGMIWDASRPDQDAPLLSPATGVLTQFRGGQHAIRIAAHRDKGAVEATWQRVVAAWQSASPACPPDALAALLARRRGDAMFIDWSSSPVAKGSYACYRSGQWTSIAGSEGEPEPDAPQLSFCGEHTAEDAPGYLEGAVESGERAAREVLVAAR